MSQSEFDQLHEKMIKLDRRWLAVLWAVCAWLAGAIFWAGSSYQRFESMDKHLEQIDLKLSVIEDVKLIRQRQDDVIRRIELLEEKHQ